MLNAASPRRGARVNAKRSVSPKGSASELPSQPPAGRSTCYGGLTAAERTAWHPLFLALLVEHGPRAFRSRSDRERGCQRVVDPVAVNLVTVAVPTDAGLLFAPPVGVQPSRFVHHRVPRRAVFWTRALRSAIGSQSYRRSPRWSRRPGGANLTGPSLCTPPSSLPVPSRANMPTAPPPLVVTVNPLSTASPQPSTTSQSRRPAPPRST
jgi:hypothetical protein